MKPEVRRPEAEVPVECLFIFLCSFKNSVIINLRKPFVLGCLCG